MRPTLLVSGELCFLLNQSLYPGLRLSLMFPKKVIYLERIPISVLQPLTCRAERTARSQFVSAHETVLACFNIEPLSVTVRSLPAYCAGKQFPISPTKKEPPQRNEIERRTLIICNSFNAFWDSSCIRLGSVSHWCSRKASRILLLAYSLKL